MNYTELKNARREGADLSERDFDSAIADTERLLVAAARRSGRTFVGIREDDTDGQAEVTAARETFDAARAALEATPESAALREAEEALREAEERNRPVGVSRTLERLSKLHAWRAKAFEPEAVRQDRPFDFDTAGGEDLDDE